MNHFWTTNGPFEDEEMNNFWNIEKKTYFQEGNSKSNSEDDWKAALSQLHRALFAALKRSPKFVRKNELKKTQENITISQMHSWIDCKSKNEDVQLYMCTRIF